MSKIEKKLLFTELAKHFLECCLLRMCYVNTHIVLYKLGLTKQSTKSKDIADLINRKFNRNLSPDNIDQRLHNSIPIIRNYLIEKGYEREDFKDFASYLNEESQYTSVAFEGINLEKIKSETDSQQREFVEC